jgi:hypothetical protein
MGEQLERYSCEHSMVAHVDVYQQSDVLMDNRLSSLDQVGSGNGRAFDSPLSNQK